METLLIVGVVILGFIVLLIIIRKSREPKNPWWWENLDKKVEKTKFSKEDYKRDKDARKAIKNQLKDEKKENK